MICQRCLYRATSRIIPPRSSLPPTTHPLHPTSHLPQPTSSRPITTTLPTPQQSLSTTAKPHATTTGSDDVQPATLSNPALVQPFSTPFTPTPPPPKAASSLPVSSVPAGTPLKGLNYLRNATDPVALEDGEYPAWLWGCLEGVRRRGGEGRGEDGTGAGGEEGGEGEGEGDLFSKSKKQRRIAAKKLRKQALLNPDSLVPKVPVHEQSVDLPAGDGSLSGAVEALGKRVEVTRAMRGVRRKGIKEANFLKGMR
ncbi:hypothetical protein MMC16_001238 [Acarospora aff. strigata]|nr:hypothetical protein [Acarospora aff. strigata]